MRRFLRHLALSLALIAGTAGLSPALSSNALPTPEGEVVLTVTGAIEARNSGDSAVFDMAMLQALPSAVITTETPWTDGPTTLKGFRLRDLLSLVGAERATLTAYALNDYESEIPPEDIERHGVLVAYLMDGSPLPPSNKGPLWIIYPFSDNPSLKRETYYARALWSLERLVIE